MPWDSIFSLMSWAEAAVAWVARLITTPIAAAARCEDEEWVLEFEIRAWEIRAGPVVLDA